MPSIGLLRAKVRVYLIHGFWLERDSHRQYSSRSYFDALERDDLCERGVKPSSNRAWILTL